MSRDLSPEWHELARQLTVRRILLGLSQQAAAKASGLQQHQISGYELGKSVPTVETLIRLADVYGLNVVLTSTPAPGGSV